MRLSILLFFLFYFSLYGFSQDKFLDIALDFRVDYNAIYNNHEHSDREMKLNVMKLIFSGSLYPGITYKVQQRLNDSWYLESDKYTSSLEDAWINFALKNKRWDFTVGKQEILFGTFESNYDPSDMYLISMVFNNFSSSQVGIAARHTFKKGNTLSFQLANVAGKQLAYSEDHAFAYTLNGFQRWLDNKLNTTFGYTLIESGNGHYFHWLTVGGQLRVKKFFVEFDGYAGRYRQNMTFNADHDNYRRSDNFSANISERYRIGKFTTFMKFALDYQHDVDLNKLSKRGIGATGGVEYHPIKGQSLRLHAAYRFLHNRYGDMWLDRYGNEVTHQLIIGMKWNVSLGDIISLIKENPKSR